MLRLLVLLLSCSAAIAADPPQVRVARTIRSDPTPGVPVRVQTGRFYPVDLGDGKPALYDADDTLVRVVILKPGERLINQVKFDEAEGASPADYTFPDAKGGVACVFALSKAGTATIKAYANGEGNGPPVKIGTVLIECLVGPQPPPGPTPPGPNPPGPTPPGPVNSFRVIFNTESATNLTATQSAVINAGAVVQYLNSHCTKQNNWPGWRSYDPQMSAEKDYSEIRDVWNSAKADGTMQPPCVIIQVNGKVTIVPFPANATEALKTLKQYGGN